MKDYSKGVLFCLTAATAWGILFPIMNQALLRIDPFTFTMLRYLIAGLAFLGVMLWREGVGALKLSGERIGLLWLFGTIGFAGFGFLVFLGQQMSGPQGALSASVMMATQPMMALLVNWIVRKTAPPKVSFFFILLSFCGVSLVISQGNPLALLHTPQNFGADMLILVGGLCWVIYTFGAHLFPHWSPYRYTSVTNLFGFVSILAITLVLYATGLVPVPSVSNVISITPHLLYAALVAGLLAVLLWNIGNKIITPMNGMLFMDVIPVTAFVISSFSGTVPSTVQIVGASLSAAALVLNNIAMRKNTAQTVQRVANEIRQCAKAATPRAAAGTNTCTAS
jgi:drug/metabolite transporter (DMT)-like permease